MMRFVVTAIAISILWEKIRQTSADVVEQSTNDVDHKIIGNRDNNENGIRAVECPDGTYQENSRVLCEEWFNYGAGNVNTNPSGLQPTTAAKAWLSSQGLEETHDAMCTAEAPWPLDNSNRIEVQTVCQSICNYCVGGAPAPTTADCIDKLPSKMITNKKCNKWKTCAKIKKHCAKTLEMALGNTAAGKSCKKAIGNSNAQKKVNEVCKETCDNCGGHQQGQQTPGPPEPGCAKHQYTCHDGQCIDENTVCDTHTDCPDGSDELDCPDTECKDTVDTKTCAKLKKRGKCKLYSTKLKCAKTCDDCEAPTTTTTTTTEKPNNGLVLIGGSSFGDSETPATKMMSEKSMRIPNEKFCDLDPYPTDGYYRSNRETNHYLNGHASVVSPNGIVTCGGKLGSRRIVGSKICKRLSSSGKWVDFPPLLNDRKHFRMKMMNGKIWAIGGWDHMGRYGFQHTLEYIDAKNPTKWKQVEIPFGVHSHCVAELPNNRLLVVGGLQHYERNHRLYEKSEYEELYGNVEYEGYIPTNKTWILDTTSQSWCQGPEMKEKRQTFDDMTRKGTGGCFSVKKNGVVTHVVVIGGYNEGPLSTTEILDVETLTWSNGPSLPSPMTDFGAVESFEVPYLGFVIGGTTNSNNAPIFGLKDTKGALQWDLVRSMDNGRYGHTIVNAPLSLLPSC